MALRAADPLGSETESVTFELDRFDLDGDQRIELRGRWFGVRGRRFVRPTLTMRIDGAKHRLLADLEHKPWAAEDGVEWVASFSPAPPAGDAKDIELAVAPDIAIPLSAPWARRPPTTVKRPAGRPSTSDRRAPRRKSEPDPALEQERAKAGDLARQLEGATAEAARLVAERDALVEERDRLRRERALFRKRVRELQGELRASQESAQAGLAEAQNRLEAERKKTRRLRSELASLAAVATDVDRVAREVDTVVADRDRAASELDTAVADRDRVARRLDTIVADRDRVARELDALVAERERLAAQDMAPAPLAADPRPGSVPRRARAADPRPRSVPRRALAARRPKQVWAHRAAAVVALCSALLLCAAVLALGFVLHVV